MYKQLTIEQAKQLTLEASNLSVAIFKKYFVGNGVANGDKVLRVSEKHRHDMSGASSNVMI